MSIWEEILERTLQEGARGDNADKVSKTILKKATEESKTMLGYITETGPEVREILDRILKQATDSKIKKRDLHLQDN